MNTDLSDTQLQELCKAFGWQGGTYHQVLRAIHAHRNALTLALMLLDSRSLTGARIAANGPTIGEVIQRAQEPGQ